MDRIQALRLFAHLAEHESFTAAARALGVKQSTASKWVAALEAELGVPLVARTTRAVALTDEGRLLLDRARGVLGSFDALVAEFSERGRSPRGHLRVSVPVVFGRLFVVPAVGDFLGRFPQVSIQLVVGDRDVRLVEEGYDLAVRVGPPTDPMAIGRQLGESRRLLVASPAYLLARGAPRSPADLRQHDCLVDVDGITPGGWRFGRGVSLEPPVAVRGRFTANNSEAVLEAARRGLGIALLADWLVGDDVRRGRLVPLLDDVSAPPAPIFALRAPSAFPSTALVALIDHLAAALAALPRDPDRTVG
ncbi:MAG: LysR family transcriptional regulator [bacterium]